MSKRLLVIPGLVVALFGLVLVWRRNRRMGTRIANTLVNPFILRSALTAGAHSEIATLEHVGRVSGIARRTPIRPVPTPDGFRIVVPLADDSQWSRNVLASGHCRMEWRGIVYELDEPRFVDPKNCAELAAPVRFVTSAVGFKYMRLHRFAEHPGSLEAVPGEPARAEESGSQIEDRVATTVS